MVDEAKKRVELGGGWKGSKEVRLTSRKTEKKDPRMGSASDIARLSAVCGGPNLIGQPAWFLSNNEIKSPVLLYTTPF